MAGITDAEFAMKLIPYGFDTVTIGGYNTDNESIEACEKIIARGRKEFNYPKEEIYINCHCRQEELVAVGCGQSMLQRPDLEDYIKEVVKKSESKVSMKMRANVEGVDNLAIARLAEDCGVDYLHIDAMKKGVRDADFDLIKEITDNTNIFIIGNNSINSIAQAERMLNAGANGISIARAAIKGKLDFDLNEIKI